MHERMTIHKGSQVKTEAKIRSLFVNTVLGGLNSVFSLQGTVEIRVLASLTRIYNNLHKCILAI